VGFCGWCFYGQVVVDCVVNVDGGLSLAEDTCLRQIFEIFLWKIQEEVSYEWQGEL
jgi:hypothetical protein